MTQAPAAAVMRRRYARLLMWALCMGAGSLANFADPALRAQGSAQAPAATTPQSAHATAIVLDIDGIIGPATADYLVRGLDQARQTQAKVVLLRLDTPGGLDTSMRDIIRAIMASPVPVLSYVTPGGARAASAGTYILYASHVAAMAPGTNLGAATPVAIGGFPGPRQPDGGRDGRKDGGKDGEGKAEPARGREDDEPAAPAARRQPASASEAKAINDAVAYLRSLAEVRGRNAEWAERAVRDAASLSANAALARNVIDIVAGDAEDLFRQAHGRQVKTGDTTVTLDTRALAQVAVEPDWRTRVLGVITNPNVALILMMIGIYGLLFEFMSPGALYPGTIGAICLLLGLYALAALPLNYAGAALALLGMALLVAEAFVPSFGILGLGGLVAFVLGVTVLMDTQGVPGFEIYWPIVGGLALAAALISLLVARLAMRSFKYKVTAGQEAMLGTRGEVMDWSGLRGHVFVHGERWNATASQPLEAGQRVTIVALDGLSLIVAVDDNPIGGTTA